MRSKRLGSHGGRCTWTVIVWPLLCCRRCILAGTLARPQLIARAGNGGGAPASPRVCAPPSLIAASWIDVGKRCSLFGARITREARPTAFARASACFSAPTTPFDSTMVLALMFQGCGFFCFETESRRARNLVWRWRSEDAEAALFYHRFLGWWGYC